MQVKCFDVVLPNIPLTMYCSIFSSYLYTPEFLKIALHLTSIISIPCHILAFYCVIFKTPRIMESVKMTMLTFCVWTAILDLQITLLSAPFTMFPVVAGFPLGYLTDLGVSALIQISINMLALIGCTTSISCLFGNRYDKITLRNSKYQQVYIYGFNMLLTCILSSICLSDIPDQISALNFIFEKLPCISSAFRSQPVFVFSSNANLIGFCACVFVLVATFEYSYFLFGTLYHLKFNNNFGISNRTRNLQKLFLFSLTLQIFIPFCIILVPWTYAVYSCFFEYYNQALNNLLTLDFGLHGTVSSISMILIHKPYRQAILPLRMEKVSIPEAKLFWRTNTRFRKTNMIHSGITSHVLL